MIEMTIAIPFTLAIVAIILMVWLIRQIDIITLDRATHYEWLDEMLASLDNDEA